MQDSGKSMVKAMNAVAAQVKAIAEELQVTESDALEVLEARAEAAGIVCGWALSASEAQSTVKAMEAIAEQVKAIAEEFQVAESVAMQILEARASACADGSWDPLMAVSGWGPSAVNGWTLSANGEEQGTGCKWPWAKTAGEIWLGKVAKSVRAMEAEAAPKATDLIETIESVWSEGTNEVEVGPIWVDSQNRVTIPHHIIELAEDINGTLNRGGALTVIKGDGKVTVLFGDKSAEREGASVVHLNCKGQAQIRVSPAFTDGDAVRCSLFRDGTIALTLIDEDELDDLLDE